MFKLGDRVKIFNTGNIYPTFRDMAIQLHATKWGEYNYYDLKPTSIGTIVGADRHLMYEEIMIYLVRIENIEILIGAKGLKLINTLSIKELYNELKKPYKSNV